MRVRARPVAMGIAIGPAGQLAIGGSKGGTGAKSEAACGVRRAAGEERTGRGEGTGPGQAGRLASGAAG